MESSVLLYFLAASVLLTVAPGPDNMYLLAKSLSEGARSGIVLSCGLVSGILFHTTLVILGIAALVASNPWAFAAIQYAGAAYLLYLAWGAFRSEGNLSIGGAGASVSYGALYRRGVLMNVLNPKVLLFFLAFLPQFVDLSGPSAGFRIALLGLVFALQGLLVFSLIAVCAARIRRLILRKKNLGQILARTEGCVLVAIAMALLLE